jgi:hypothetical protein
MDASCGMERAESSGKLRERRTQARRFRSHPLREVHALDELHSEEETLVFSDQLEKGREIRVCDVRDGAKLLLEPKHGGRVPKQQGLQGNGPTALQVIGAVDDSHASSAQLGEHPVAPENGPGRNLGAPRASRTTLRGHAHVSVHQDRADTPCDGSGDQVRTSYRTLLDDTSRWQRSPETLLAQR